MVSALNRNELIARVTAALKRRRKIFDKDTLASEKQSTQAICDLLGAPEGKPDTRWKALPRPVLYELARDAFECDANADGGGPAGMTLYSLKEGNSCLESGERITAAMAQAACRAWCECGDDTVLCRLFEYDPSGGTPASKSDAGKPKHRETLFTVKDVSKRLHVSHTTVLSRLKKLTAQGVTGASTRVGRKRGGTG
jgi:hypothetical protein